jgi:hypothetical protein
MREILETKNLESSRKAFQGVKHNSRELPFDAYFWYQVW